MNPLILSLRKELYTLPYHILDWDQAKNLCAKVFSCVIYDWCQGILSYSLNVFLNFMDVLIKSGCIQLKSC